MAAAYAVVVSLMHLMDQIKIYHHRHPIFLYEQLRQLESLQEIVSFLQDFLESYSRGSENEARNDLESQIADAAYAAEDIIETYIVDDIQARSTSTGKPSSKSFSHELDKVMQQMEFIKEEIVMKIINEQSTELRNHQLVDSLIIPLIPTDTVVVFEDDAIQIMDELTAGQQSNLQVISITGMGGIGKTTLAKYIYVNSLVVEMFDIRGWLTISQEYNVRELLLRLLHEIGENSGHTEEESGEYHRLGEKLYKHLCGRKYLIVMDDLWSVDAWDKLKLFLPDNNNSSRVIVITRLAYVAETVGSHHHKMNLLNEDKSWSILCSKAFHQECCPPEFKEIGKSIAKKCKGLPLSISVIAGLLAKTKKREYWEHIDEVIHTTYIALEEDEHCLNILSLSYSHLPIHLKPCFLYFGLFPEDEDIHVSQLIKLWVAEGFLKPEKVKTLEEVAVGFLKNLIDRNLVFVSKLGSSGKLKRCKIHDLLRDLCLREARKEKFLHVTNVHDPNTSQGVNKQRRIVIHGSTSNKKHSLEVSRALQSALLPRSLTCNIKLDLPMSQNLLLLKVLNVVDEYPEDVVLQLLNARYLNSVIRFSTWKLPSSICELWNLQTLNLTTNRLEVEAPREIWELSQLRHLKIIQAFYLPEPYKCGFGHVLENLQTLSFVMHFRCTQDVTEKIPNIEKLKISYMEKPDKELSYYCLQNIGRLHKLQTLKCGFPPTRDWMTRADLLKNLKFPLSLKKLTLIYCNLDWEDIETKIGWLPNLEILLLTDCFVGDKWEPVEGQFLNLKFLDINDGSLVYWIAESNHFPRLEHLVLRFMKRLKEIPFEIGYIETLQSITLGFCGGSVVTSAKKILREQQSLENYGLCIWESGEPMKVDDIDDDDDDDDEENEVDDNNDNIDVDGEEDSYRRNRLLLGYGGGLIVIGVAIFSFFFHRASRSRKAGKADPRLRFILSTVQHKLSARPGNAIPKPCQDPVLLNFEDPGPTLPRPF